MAWRCEWRSLKIYKLRFSGYKSEIFIHILSQ